MTFSDLTKTALVGLYTNKSRSALTMLGIVIGIAAIILVVALGNGARGLILGEIQSMGAEIIAVVPGREPQGPSDFASTFTDSLKQRDIDALQNKANVPHMKRVMPIVFGSQTALYNGETYRPTIFGVSDFFTELYGISPSEGRTFSEEEVRGYSDTVVIGSKVKEELFGSDDAIGQRIRIKSKNYRVIGVLGGEGQSVFLNFDTAVLVPYTTAGRDLFGIKYFNRIVVEADSDKHVADTVEDVKETIRASHGISDPLKDDFFIETQADALEMVGTITNTLTLFLAAIAAISLIVGGIGIMNIMFVSVTERTREIGLRKALGATEKNILLQFLMEAVILTGIGGTIGILTGSSLAILISEILSRTVVAGWEFTFPFQAALLGLGVSSAVGLVFGIVPARQASRKSPIESLRYE